MNTKLIAQIRKNMESKKTAELFQIWTVNDRNQYSDEAFEIIKSILLEREITIPSQDSSSIIKQTSFRIKRRSFVFVYFFQIIISIFIFSIHIKTPYEGIHPISYVIGAVFFFLNIYMIIGRLHDINRTGWWILSMFIPLLNLIILLFLCILPGTKGENIYGVDPRARNNADQLTK